MCKSYGTRGGGGEQEAWPLNSLLGWDKDDLIENDINIVGRVGCGTTSLKRNSANNYECTGVRTCRAPSRGVP